MKGPFIKFSLLLPSNSKQLKERKPMNSQLETEIPLNGRSFIFWPVRIIFENLAAGSFSSCDLWEPVFLVKNPKAVERDN